MAGPVHYITNLNIIKMILVKTLKQEYDCQIN